jgi:glutamate--cysteine ligase
MDKIYDYFVNGFTVARQDHDERRIGAELKFPLVNSDGSAASFETVCKLWEYLKSSGWRPVKDNMSGHTIGAKRKGQLNDTIAGCETGYCKVEFSLAHVGNLFRMEKQINELREELQPFCKDNNATFLCYGIHPVTLPCRNLMMKKGRTSPWVKAFGSNRHISRENGDDVHLFTINAASHVHISVTLEEAVDAVNILNGFSGPQIALTANSNIWENKIDPDYKCVAEKFWDWWMPDCNRVGVPLKPFENIKDYVRTVANLKPVYVVRNGKPIILQKYKTFDEYYRAGRAVGTDKDNKEVSFTPDKSDIDLHNSCYWYNSRISRYYTVENRVNDQQPPDALLSVSALTLGLVSALAEAKDEISLYDWQTLRQMREIACQHGLDGKKNTIRLVRLALRMLVIARLGLLRRGLGEEKYLAPLEERLCSFECPADRAADIFEDGGAGALVNKWKF